LYSISEEFLQLASFFLSPNAFELKFMLPLTQNPHFNCTNFSLQLHKATNPFEDADFMLSRRAAQCTLKSFGAWCWRSLKLSDISAPTPASSTTWLY